MRRLLNVLLVIFSFQTFALASGISGGTNPNVNISSAGASNLSVNADGGLNVHTVNSSGSSGSGGGPIQTLTVSGSTVTVGYAVGASSVPVNVLNTVGITGSISNTGFNVNNTPSVSQSGTWTVQPGNTANTTAWKVDGSAVTQPVSGTVTANAGSGTFNIQSNASANITQYGGTTVDPCKGQAKLYISISQTGNTQLVTGTSSKKIYICSIHYVSATAQNIALVEGTGTVCATSTAGVKGFGGATAATGLNLAANGGITYGDGDSSLGAEGTNADNLCLFQSGSGQLSGGFSYAVQ